MNFNAAHWHLLLNHLPIFGVIFGAALLLYALVRRSDEIVRVALGSLVLCALFVVPAYLTGEPAQSSLQDASGASLPYIQSHQRAAKIGAFVTVALGVVSLASLLAARRNDEIPCIRARILFVFSLFVAAWLSWVGMLGGQIRHEEIRPERISR